MKKLLFTFFFSAVIGLTQSQTLTPTDNLAVLRGIVTNFKGKVLSNEVILLVNEKTKAVFKITTDSKGKFELLIPVDATYSLKYRNFTTDVDYTKMILPPDKQAEYDVRIKIEPPKEFVMDNVYFDSGKATLKLGSNKALNNLVEVLKAKSTMTVEIQGHTDDVGKEEDNLKLSQGRADAVKNYLISKGIAKDRIIAKGYGWTQPIADNGTEAGKAKNRRTSLKVIKE
jgi:outer membrane protein OmpA-like peptidoglycan-associated protein